MSGQEAKVEEEVGGIPKKMVEEISGLKKAQKVMEFLGDREVRSMKEIAAEIRLSDEQATVIIDFLAKGGFVEQTYHLVRITKSGLGFLELPGDKEEIA